VDATGHVRKKRWRVPLLIVAVVLVMIAAAFAWYSRDDAPPDDADLRLIRETIPDEENAFTYIKQAVDALNLPEDYDEKERIRDLIEPDQWDEALAAEVLGRNEKALELMAQAAQCARCQFPEVTGFDTRLPYLSPCRDMARLGAIRAEQLLRQGKENEAFDQVMVGLRFGHRIQDSANCVVTYLVGVSVTGLAKGQIESILPRTSLTADQLKPYIAELGDYRPSERGLINAHKTEYAVQARLVDDFAAGRRTFGSMSFEAETGESCQHSGVRAFLIRARNTFTLKPNRTKRLFASTMRLFIRNAPRFYADIEPYAPWEMPETRDERLKLAFDGNSCGVILHAMLTRSLRHVAAVKARADSSISAMQMLIALRCHQLERGDLPDALDELVPAYFESVPLDAFDGQPLKYSKEKRIIYSVDTNLIDDGGQHELDRTLDQDAGRDWVWKIEF